MYKADTGYFKHRRLVLHGYIDIDLYLWSYRYMFSGPVGDNSSAISAVKD